MNDFSCERCQGIGYFLESSTEALSDCQASVKLEKSCIYQVRENSRVFQIVVTDYARLHSAAKYRRIILMF